jgi:hypothetical protein
MNCFYIFLNGKFESTKYSKIVLDVDCQTLGHLKSMIELYFGEKSVINSKYLIRAPSCFS